MEATIEDFSKLSIHTGTILSAKLNEKARRPAYVLTVDFGPLGVKTTSAQITDNYQAQNLIGQQVVAVTNFPIKRVAGVKSEVLILAAVCDREGTVLLTPHLPVTNGAKIA